MSRLSLPPQNFAPLLMLLHCEYRKLKWTPSRWRLGHIFRVWEVYMTAHTKRVDLKGPRASFSGSLAWKNSAHTGQYFSDVLYWEYLLAPVYWIRVWIAPGKKQSTWRPTRMYAVSLWCGQWRTEGGFVGGGGFRPPRNSEVLTKLRRIPSSVENSSLTT
jgi:hypothetical protein